MSDALFADDWIAELHNVYTDTFSGNIGNDMYRGGPRARALQAVARHVLADADCWRQRLGMDPIAPEVAGYHHHITEPRSTYALPTVHAVAGNLSYGPPRSLEERLARASLSGAEGQE